jgi:tripartite-type tricarboxylate transporter receptor subunit TctC
MRRAALGCVVALAAAPAAAQQYPTKPIRLIIPSPAGGGMDNLGRTVGAGLTNRWGQQVVVDTRPGAAGIVGTDLAAKAPADGYTLLLAWVAPLAINPGLYKKLPYDVLTDFEPLMEVATTPHVLVVPPGFKAATVKEFIAAAKAAPGTVSYGSSGIGGSSHLAGELFAAMAGVKLLHVPYKGTPPALVDLMAGRIQASFAAAAPALPHIHSGKIKALAVTTRTASPNVPGLPPIANLLPGYEAHTWYAIMAPAGTPKSIIEMLNETVARHLREPEVNATLSKQGFDIVASTPEAFAKFLKTELAKWAKVVAAAGLRAE